MRNTSKLIQTELNGRRFTDIPLDERGRIGERIAYLVLRDMGFDFQQQLDRLVRTYDPVSKTPVYTCVEVKFKEVFEAGENCPYEGYGLDKRQVIARSYLLKELGIRTILFCIEPNRKVIYWQYLDVLENGTYTDLYNGLKGTKIRVYPLTNFETVADDLCHRMPKGLLKNR